MARVAVEPQQYNLVSFEPDRIATLVGEVADRIGLPADLEVRITVEERSPLTRTRLLSIDPVHIDLEGGAIEDPTHPRHLSDRGVVDAIGRLLLRARDRRDPAFGEPPAEDDLDLQQQTAWDAYTQGRLARLGYDVRQPRRRYHFRSRHGFTDVADAVFDRLWAADGLTWADLEAAGAETAQGRDVPAAS